MSSIRDKNRFRKTYSFLRTQPQFASVVQAVGPHQYDSASTVDLQRFRKTYDPYARFQPPELEFTDYERGSFFFENDYEISFDFNRTFLSPPIVVIYLEDYYDNFQDNTIAFIVETNTSGATVSTAAPFRGKVHYLAIYFDGIQHRSAIIENVLAIYEIGIIPMVEMATINYSFIEEFPAAPTVTASAIDLGGNGSINTDLTISNVTTTGVTFTTSAAITGGISFHAVL